MQPAQKHSVCADQPLDDRYSPSLRYTTGRVHAAALFGIQGSTDSFVPILRKRGNSNVHPFRSSCGPLDPSAFNSTIDKTKLT
ncbi:unnamed protein product, partial [Larinioides sclopetarius]